MILKCFFFFSLILFGQNPEHDGNEMQEDLKEEGNEEAVVLDADSTDGAVLVNGNEAEEQWGTNNAGNPPA